MRARTPGNPVPTHGDGKTAQGYIAGIGASGALLAGAVVTFVFLVGAVSFEVWPTAAHESSDDSLGIAELSGPGGAESSTSTSSLGEAVGLLAAAVPSEVTAPATPDGAGGLKGTGGGSDPGSDTGTDEVPGGGATGDDGSGIAGEIPDDPTTAPDQGSGGGSGGSNRPDREDNGSGGGTNGGGSGSTNSGSAGSTGGGTTGPGWSGSNSGSNHSDR
jgi:hypothetical protein